MSFLKAKSLKRTVYSMLFRGDSGLAETLYFWMMISAAVTCLIFAVYDFKIGQQLIASILVLVALIISFSIYLLYQKVIPSIWIYQISAMVFFILFSLLVNSSGNNIERLFWCYTFPIATTFVIGVRRGMLWSGLFLCVTTTQLLFFLENHYTQSFLFTFVMVYTIIMTITGWIEFYKNKYYQKIKLQHSKLKLEIEKKQLLEQKLTIMSQVDSLSGLWNQRHFWNLVETRKNTAKKNEQLICMAVIDIDNFKQINDSYGHPNGDQVIRAVADKIKQHIGEPHLAGRIGGDEFAILFVNQECYKSYKQADELRAEIAAMRLDCIEGAMVTISIGLATLKNYSDLTSRLYKNADSALYEAKHKGRNQVVKSKQ